MTHTENEAGRGLTAAPTWPDTTGQATAPTDDTYASAVWLLGRHPQLARLAGRVPGLVTVDRDGLCIDLELLAEAFAGVVEYGQAFRAYVAQNPEPNVNEDPVSHRIWCDAEPRPSRQARGLVPMSRSEIMRLRLLATFASTGVSFSLGALWGFDPEGRRLLDDWCLAVHHV